MVTYLVVRNCFKLIFVFFILAFLIFPTKTYAKTNSFVTIVNPVRGGEFWNQNNQKPSDVVKAQMEIINSQKTVATWLIRFDVLSDKNIIALLKGNPKHEVGVFFEVLPSLTEAANVKYHKSNSWHDPESVFLTGYSVEDRQKMIDTFFGKFKEVFGFYPKSVGAWWIDANSLDYMNKKYGAVAAMITSDQYSTDNYRVWGQYWGAPYYPFKKNTLLPAQTTADKIPVAITQWAARDPFNAYGKAVEESTYSVQANDYLDYHQFDIDYFNKLVDIYTQTDNKISQLIVGLENSYNWSKYSSEYEKQIKSVASKANKGNFAILTMSEFANIYKNTHPEISPATILFAQDPLNPNYKVVWFMNPYYRAGLFFDKKGIRFRDIREYSHNEEPCFQKICNRLSFINSFISSVDEVVNGKSFYIDEAGGQNIQVLTEGDKTIVKYTNSEGKNRTIEFLPKDISIDGTNYTISGLILKTHQEYYEREPKSEPSSKENIFTLLLKLLELIKNFIYGIIP